MTMNNVLTLRGKRYQHPADLQGIMAGVGAHLDAIRAEIDQRMSEEEDTHVRNALARFMRLLDKEEQNLLTGVTSIDELLG